MIANPTKAQIAQFNRTAAQTIEQLERTQVAQVELAESYEKLRLAKVKAEGRKCGRLLALAVFLSSFVTAGT